MPGPNWIDDDYIAYMTDEQQERAWAETRRRLKEQDDYDRQLTALRRNQKLKSKKFSGETETITRKVPSRYVKAFIKGKRGLVLINKKTEELIVENGKAFCRYVSNGPTYRPWPSNIEFI